MVTSCRGEEAEETVRWESWKRRAVASKDHTFSQSKRELIEVPVRLVDQRMRKGVLSLCSVSVSIRAFDLLCFPISIMCSLSIPL